ncbi:MAG: hypothetical protein LBB56_05190 [Chitinispirillales bacterium]|jgi:hypothetical protein|nr:hypothetical protein [Chitinispirillales bacterium]
MEKRVLTEDIRRELLGLVPFSAGSSDSFTPPVFLKKNSENQYAIPEEFRPVFKVRCFTVEEKRAVTKLLVNIKEADEGAVTEAARIAVIGWKNLFDAGSGEELVFKPAPDGGADPALFSGIPAAVAGALLFHASRISGIIAAEKLSLK